MASEAGPRRETPPRDARLRLVEPAAALAACSVVALVLTWRLLEPHAYSEDAFVHQYWMWSFRDPELFTDPLTEALRASARFPDGYEGLFWLATRVTGPIAFGEWLGAALMAVSAWLVFLIVREHGGWRPAAWIAAGLFLALIDIHRFHGGFPRAFVHPVVLLTVLLAIRGRHLAAALVAAAGALLYPPAALLALGVLAVSAVGWHGRRPRVEARRAAFAGLAAVLALAAVLVPVLLGDGAPSVFTADQARAYAEFRPRGVLHFFADSTLEYLRQNRSGFDLRESGSILLLAALALLALRPSNLGLLRREVLALPVVALALFALAQALLFRLYLPHRYTYPLTAFSAIAVALTLHPTWTALCQGNRPRLRAAGLVLAPGVIACVALYAFPLGPLRPLDELATATAAAIAVAAIALAALLTTLIARASPFRAPRLGATLTAAALLAVLVAVVERPARGSECAHGPVIDFLGSLPKDAVIAGDPIHLECLPVTARRPVVISAQLASSYEPDYFREARRRMFAMLRAYYGPSADAIADLRSRYGATHLWVRESDIRDELAGGRNAHWRAAPYGPFVRGLVALGMPAVESLPAACRRWQSRGNEVYDIACITRRLEASSEGRPGRSLG